MLWNAEAAGWVPAGTARRVFTGNRRRVLRGLADGRIRIEINPFLHPLAPELHEIVDPTHIVHLVRDARDWITSMANFGAAGWRRHVIDFVPFARTIPPGALDHWRSLDTITRFAWRWRLANEQLLASAEHAGHYCLVRYEDLFSADRSQARAALLRLLAAMPPGDAGAPFDANWTQRVNPSPGGKIGPWRQWPRDTQETVMEICGPLLESFGYT